MTMLKRLTNVLIIMTVLVWIVWDIYVYLVGGDKPTISVVITDWYWKFPQLGLAAMYVAGHWFWQNKCPVCNKEG